MSMKTARRIKKAGTLTGRTEPIEEAETRIPIGKEVDEMFKELSEITITFWECVGIYHIETTWT